MARYLFKKAMLYAKTAFFSGSIALIAFFGMLHTSMDPVDALFYMLLIYIFLFAGILAAVEERRTRRRRR